MNRVIAPASITAALLLWTLAVGAQGAPQRYSAMALYNQANAYARGGQPGLAVLHYERARLLAPQDGDIEANLRIVRESQHLWAPARSTLERLSFIQPPTIAAFSGLLGMVLLGVSLVWGRLFGEHRLIRGASGGFGAALIAATLCQGALLWPALRAAVVVTHEASVLESPVPMGERVFMLPEAETVAVTAEHENFLLVRTRDGRAGWVSGASVARVVPGGAARW